MPADDDLVNRVRLETASAIRDVLARVGPACSREWVREQLGRIADRLEAHAGPVVGWVFAGDRLQQERRKLGRNLIEECEARGMTEPGSVVTLSRAERGDINPATIPPRKCCRTTGTPFSGVECPDCPNRVAQTPPAKCGTCNGRGELRKCRRCGVVYLSIHKYSDCGSPGCDGEESDATPCPDCLVIE